MKKKTRVFLVMTMMTVFCVMIIFLGENQVNQHTVVVPPKEVLPSKPELLLDAYIPIAKDTVWSYDTPEGEATMWIDFLKEGVFQIRIHLGERVVAKVLVEDDDAIYEVATIEDAFAKIDYTHLRQYKDIVLKFPTQVGDTWELTDGRVKEVIATDEKCDTPFGEVNTIKVKTTKDEATHTVYFGEQLGVIRAEYEGPDGVYAIELTKRELNKRMMEEMNVYVINKEKNQIESFNQEVPIRTNEEAIHFITDVLKKTAYEKYLPALPINGMITNIYRDQQLQKVHVELNDAYLHRGYSTEEDALALQCLVNTIADYYGVNEVGIAIEGNPHYSWIKKQY